jgi:DNA-binding CsgD family transcriptional regulator
MRTRLTSSRFVGRVGELSELLLAVREAASGRASLVLLGGDSGVGKTRLIAELEGRLAQDGEPEPATLVLRGDGVQQTDGELPYALLLGALRPLVRAHHPALDALAPGSRAQLATLLPGLEPAAGARDPRVDPNAQLRLFEALLELIDRLSETGPVVLILEDMHWADRSTRSFAGFLARSLRHERVCVILTYRTDELHRRHPLRPLLAELERLERARRVALEPFDRDELAQALNDILGAAPAAELLERLFRRSEGNPLYTEELLAAGLDGRGAAPQSLRDAFLLRIERLSVPAQQVARAVAVGRTLDEAALTAVTGLDRETAMTALRETVAEQVIVDCGVDRFGFRHALLREALLHDLLPGERGELHIALARRLEEGHDGSESELERSAAIAGHYAAAGDQPQALRTTVAAARVAHGAFAFGEAADLGERALALWPRVPDAERVAAIDHIELLAATAQACSAINDRLRAEALLGQALRELDGAGEPARYARLLGRMSRIVWTLNRGPEAADLAQRALGVLGEDDAGRDVRPLLLAWVARMAFLRGKFRQAVSDGETALAEATAVGDRFAETEILNTLGMARMALQDVDGGAALLRGAIALARETGDLDSLTTAYSNLADLLCVVGRTTEALEVAREGMAATPRHHIRSHTWISLTLSEIAFEAGDWETARRMVAGPRAASAGTLFMFRALREAELALAAGGDAAAHQSLDAVAELVELSSEPQWIAAYGALRGELAIREHDLETAQRAAAQALDRLELCTDDVMRIARVSVVALEVEADRAQRARDLRDTAARRDALARCRIHLDRLAAAAQEGGPVERARLAQGRAEVARARGRASVAADWAKAAAAWEAIDRPYPAAIARWRQAEALVMAGRREEATAAASAAFDRARALGAAWLAGEVSGLAERARLEIAVAGNGAGGSSGDGDGDGDAGGARAPGHSSEPEPFGLTARERQVLALLAQGATNRQIGAALFMAEKTASVHVSRILSKLDVRSRTQAAAVAHRLHLV